MAEDSSFFGKPPSSRGGFRTRSPAHDDDDEEGDDTYSCGSHPAAAITAANDESGRLFFNANHPELLQLGDEDVGMDKAANNTPQQQQHSQSRQTGGSNNNNSSRSSPRDGARSIGNGEDGGALERADVEMMTEEEEDGASNWYQSCVSGPASTRTGTSSYRLPRRFSSAQPSSAHSSDFAERGAVAGAVSFPSSTANPSLEKGRQRRDSRGSDVGSEHTRSSYGSRHSFSCNGRRGGDDVERLDRAAAELEKRLKNFSDYGSVTGSQQQQQQQYRGKSLRERGSSQGSADSSKLNEVVGLSSHPQRALSQEDEMEKKKASKEGKAATEMPTRPFGSTGGRRSGGTSSPPPPTQPEWIARLSSPQRGGMTGSLASSSRRNSITNSRADAIMEAAAQASSSSSMRHRSGSVQSSRSSSSMTKRQQQHVAERHSPAASSSHLSLHTAPSGTTATTRTGASASHGERHHSPHIRTEKSEGSGRYVDISDDVFASRERRKPVATAAFKTGTSSSRASSTHQSQHSARSSHSARAESEGARRPSDTLTTMRSGGVEEIAGGARGGASSKALAALLSSGSTGGSQLRQRQQEATSAASSSVHERKVRSSSVGSGNASSRTSNASSHGSAPRARSSTGSGGGGGGPAVSSRPSSTSSRNAPAWIDRLSSPIKGRASPSSATGRSAASSSPMSSAAPASSVASSRFSSKPIYTASTGSFDAAASSRSSKASSTHGARKGEKTAPVEPRLPQEMDEGAFVKLLTSCRNRTTSAESSTTTGGPASARSSRSFSSNKSRRNTAALNTKATAKTSSVGTAGSSNVGARRLYSAHSQSSESKETFSGSTAAAAAVAVNVGPASTGSTQTTREMRTPRSTASATASTAFQSPVRSLSGTRGNASSNSGMKSGTRATAISPLRSRTSRAGSNHSRGASPSAASVGGGGAGSNHSSFMGYGQHSAGRQRRPSVPDGPLATVPREELQRLLQLPTRGGQMPVLPGVSRLDLSREEDMKEYYRQQYVVDPELRKRPGIRQFYVKPQADLFGMYAAWEQNMAEQEATARMEREGSQAEEKEEAAIAYSNGGGDGRRRDGSETEGVSAGDKSLSFVSSKTPVSRLLVTKEPPKAAAAGPGSFVSPPLDQEPLSLARSTITANIMAAASAAASSFSGSSPVVQRSSSAGAKQNKSGRSSPSAAAAAAGTSTPPHLRPAAGTPTRQRSKPLNIFSWISASDGRTGSVSRVRRGNGDNSGRSITNSKGHQTAAAGVATEAAQLPSTHITGSSVRARAPSGTTAAERDHLGRNLVPLVDENEKQFNIGRLLVFSSDGAAAAAGEEGGGSDVDAANAQDGGTKDDYLDVYCDTAIAELGNGSNGIDKEKTKMKNASAKNDNSAASRGQEQERCMRRKITAMEGRCVDVTTLNSTQHGGDINSHNGDGNSITHETNSTCYYRDQDADWVADTSSSEMTAQLGATHAPSTSNEALEISESFQKQQQQMLATGKNRGEKPGNAGDVLHQNYKSTNICSSRRRTSVDHASEPFGNLYDNEEGGGGGDYIEVGDDEQQQHHRHSSEFLYEEREEAEGGEREEGDDVSRGDDASHSQRIFLNSSSQSNSARRGKVLSSSSFSDIHDRSPDTGCTAAASAQASGFQASPLVSINSRNESCEPQGDPYERMTREERAERQRELRTRMQKQEPRDSQEHNKTNPHPAATRRRTSASPTFNSSQVSNSFHRSM